MEPRKTGGYYCLVLITNLLIPYRYWGLCVLWGKTQVLEQCRCDAPTHWALRKSFTGGVASMHVLRWLSQQALTNNVSGAYTVVKSQLAAIWEQMPSGCQIVILSFSIQLVFLWIGFWPFFSPGRVVPEPNNLRFMKKWKYESLLLLVKQFIDQNFSALSGFPTFFFFFFFVIT